MKNIERWWVLTGLVFLLVGMGLGLKMSMAKDYSMHGLHAHLNLLGFVLMTFLLSSMAEHAGRGAGHSALLVAHGNGGHIAYLVLPNTFKL